MSTHNSKFLGTFDDNSNQQPQPVAGQPPVFVVQPQAPAAAPAPTPPAPAAPAPQENSIPVSALPQVLQAMSQSEQDTIAALEQARLQQMSVYEDEDDDGEEFTGSGADGRVTIRDVMAQMQEMQDDLHLSRMETYRERAINQAREEGGNLVDSLVFGATPEEIDASVQVARAEYDYVAAQVARDIQEQATLAAQQPQPHAVVGQVGGQPAVPQQQAPVAYQQQAPQPPHGAQQPISAPSMIQAPGVPQQAPQQQGVLDPQTLHYLTTTGVRTGEYQMYRPQIMAALRAGTLGPGGRPWSFNNSTPQLAPPVPQTVPAPVQQQQAHFAGVPPMPHPGAAPPMQPQQLPVAAPPQPAVAPQPAYPGASPMAPGMMAPQQQYIQTPTGHQVPTAQTGYAAQPEQVEQGVPIDTGAARAAAQAAVAARRGQAAGLPSIHEP